MTGKEIPEIITQQFNQFKDIRCWCVCSKDKMPLDTTVSGYRLLRWIEERYKLLTLSELRGYTPLYDGFGLIIGELGDNAIRCIDLDHCLENGEPKNEKITEFLEAFHTFTEISSSGTGLHLFFEYPVKFDEFNLRKDFSEGKAYCSRFIKLTGIIYKNFGYMVRYITDREFENIRNELSENRPVYVPSSPANFNGIERSWNDILNEAGIIHIRAGYEGKERRGLVAIEAWKIPCPNRNKHSDHHRPGDFSADAAILIRWSDGSSSLTCNHNACSPLKRPNLLRLLWREIKGPKILRGKELLKKMGVPQDGI